MELLPILETPHRVVCSSGNGKVGPGAVVTYRPIAETCPPDCPMMWRWEGGVRLPGPCYAKRGRVAGVAKRSANHNETLWQAVGAPFVRHLVSGDCMRPDAAGRMILDVPYVRHVFEFHRLSPLTTGWLYTHAWRRFRDALRLECPPTLHMLASVNDLASKREANRKGWRTARVTTDLDDKQADEVVCPYDKEKERGKPNRINCMRCRLCWTQPKSILFKEF